MVDSVKNSYRLGKVLKKLLGFGLGDSFQEAEISEEGKTEARKYYSDRSPVRHLKSLEQPTDSQMKAKQEKYIQYQKELKASRHLQTDYRPQSPDRILKLPIDRLKIGEEE
ncbi:MAG: hypothetical protein GY866_10350 [Proteobacteria bacterium]|nr:hypothetical protein [Pseudomonadota bacterium]